MSLIRKRILDSNNLRDLAYNGRRNFYSIKQHHISKSPKMKRIKLSISVLALALLFLVFATPTTAQQVIRFDNMQVDLWAEYDQPESVLVIYRGTLSADISLPATVTMRIPTSAGDPYAVAVREPDGSPFTVVYDRTVVGEWAEITFNATLPGVQLEYYDPNLEITDTQRNYVYTWPGGYEVESSMLVLVQNPMDATNLLTTPRLSTRTQDGNGVVYDSVDLGPLGVNDTFELTIDYEKTTDDLTIDFLNLQPSTPISSATDGRVDTSDLIPWGVGIAGMLLLFTGLWFMYYNRRKPAPQKSKKRRRRSTSSAPKSSVSGMDGGNTFCQNCGKRADGNDKFCRSCGTKLRL